MSETRRRDSGSAFAIGALCLAVWAAPAIAGITIEERVLADGTPVVLLGEQLYLADAQGVLTRAGSGEFTLQSGKVLTVRAGKVRLGPGGIRRFDPQPEPPGRILRLTGAGGERLLLTAGRLYVEDSGGRRLCPDGTHRLAGNARVVVRGGQVQSISDLSGAKLGDPIGLIEAPEIRH